MCSLLFAISFHRRVWGGDFTAGVCPRYPIRLDTESKPVEDIHPIPSFCLSSQTRLDALIDALFCCILLTSPGEITHSSFLRHIEGEPIPDTPTSGVILLQTFPAFRKESSSHYSSVPSESPSDRRPDGAEEPDLAANSFYGERRSSRMSGARSSDILSSHSKLQQIPEREPLIRRSVRYSQPQLSPPNNSIATRQRPCEFKVIPRLESNLIKRTSSWLREHLNERRKKTCLIAVENKTRYSHWSSVKS